MATSNCKPSSQFFKGRLFERQFCTLYKVSYSHGGYCSTDGSCTVFQRFGGTCCLHLQGELILFRKMLVSLVRGTCSFYFVWRQKSAFPCLWSSTTFAASLHNPQICSFPLLQYPHKPNSFCLKMQAGCSSETMEHQTCLTRRKNRIEQNRTEHSRTEQNRSEQSRAEQNRAE